MAPEDRGESSERARILVVDDDPSVVDYLSEMLIEDGHAVTGTTRPLEALELLESTGFDLVVSDVEMPDLRGMDLMAEIHRRRPQQLVVLITAFGSIDTAVRAIRAGACDFVTKPFRFEVLQVVLERALRERRMRREIVRLRGAMVPAHRGGIVAHAPRMQKAVSLARRAARSDATVLITGESGVGKGLVARFVHDESERRSVKFTQVNCAAIPAPLAEAELFGAVRGAYTGAEQTRSGLFSTADRGTLFLDEIGETPLEVQAKLLQAIETGRIRPVGSDVDHGVDVRLVVATNRTLEDAVRQGRFREDLYYRLNVIRIDVPPLRERPEDLQPLIDVLLERACSKVGREIVGLADEATRWLLSQSWPGNVRELANVLERAVVLAEHDVIVLDDLVSPGEEPAADHGFLRRAARAGMRLAQVELEYIRSVISECGGNKKEAAKVLGIDRRTLYRRLEEAE